MCILKTLDVIDCRFPSFMCNLLEIPTIYTFICKGGESAINYIKRFQNAQALSVLVGNSYSEDQIMHTFLDNFHQSENTQLN